LNVTFSSIPTWPFQLGVSTLTLIANSPDYQVGQQ
jgi:hypothetical protein